MALPVVIAALPLSKVNPPTTATFWDVSIVIAVVVPFVFNTSSPVVSPVEIRAVVSVVPADMDDIIYSYANETLPVPAVKVVTLKPPAVAVESVRPPPGLEIVLVSGYLSTTMPEPPAPEFGP